jgi:adenylate cyclase
MSGIDAAKSDTGIRGWLNRHLPSHIVTRAFVIAAALTFIVLLLLLAAGPLLSALDHWTADLRTAFFTYQLDTQHPAVALVTINEDAITEAQKNDSTKYRSPIDRGLLARLVTALDGIGPKGAGFDIIVDQPSEPAKDEAFLAALKGAHIPLVLARLDVGAGRAITTTDERTYHADFLDKAARTSGYVTVKAEADGVVRTQPTPGTGGRATFPEEIAKLGGWRPSKPALLALIEPSERIAWLRPPIDNSTTFLTIPARTLMTPRDQLSAFERDAVDQLKNKLVIVGVKFHDNTDRHRTPLNKSGEDLTSGSEINAQVVAQLVDGRSYYELTVLGQLGLSFVTALLAVWAGWRFRRSNWLVGSVPLAVYAFVTTMVFWQYKIILPFAAPALAWFAGVYSGSLLNWRDRKQGRIAAAEKRA